MPRHLLIPFQVSTNSGLRLRPTFLGVLQDTTSVFLRECKHRKDIQFIPMMILKS